MLARRHDEAFWQTVDNRIAEQLPARVSLGVVTLLIQEIFGDVPPDYLARLIQTDVSQAIRLWVARYGRKVLSADKQGTKHYLLLISLLPGYTMAARRKHLVPRGLPPMITHGYAGERLLSRIRRYQIQMAFILYRLRFHCVEGARYFVESSRFRRLLMGVEQ